MVNLSMQNIMENAMYSFGGWFRFTGKVFAAFTGLAFTVTVLLYFNQDRMLYIPNPPGLPKTPHENPPSMNHPGEWNRNGRFGGSESDRIPFEEIFITTADGVRLHLWLLLQNPDGSEQPGPGPGPGLGQGDSSPPPTLIYFHGNAGNMGFRLKNAAKMFARVGINVLMMDYRGYGFSEGSPSEEGLNADAQAVLLHALNHPKLKGSPIVLFGRSLGGAVAISLAHKYPDKVSAIIVENTFLSVSAMVDVLMPYVSWIKELVLKIGWYSDGKIADLAHPMLFISGDSDELVPPKHMSALFRLALKSKDKEFFSVSGGHHNDTWEVADGEYYKRMRRFLERTLGPYSPSQKGTEVAPARVVLPSTSSSSGTSSGTSADTVTDWKIRGSSYISEPEEESDPDYLMVERPSRDDLTRNTNAEEEEEEEEEVFAAIPTMDKQFRVT